MDPMGFSHHFGVSSRYVVSGWSWELEVFGAPWVEIWRKTPWRPRSWRRRAASSGIHRIHWRNGSPFTCMKTYRKSRQLIVLVNIYQCLPGCFCFLSRTLGNILMKRVLSSSWYLETCCTYIYMTCIDIFICLNIYDLQCFLLHPYQTIN